MFEPAERSTDCCHAMAPPVRAPQFGPARPSNQGGNVRILSCVSMHPAESVWGKQLKQSQ